MYSVKNIQMCQGRQGIAYSCDLYKNFKKIGTLNNSANGGSTCYYLDSGEEKKLLAYAQNYLNDDWYEAHDEYIEQLINSALENQ